MALTGRILMKHTSAKIIIPVLMLLVPFGTSAQLSASPARFSPQPEGYLERAAAMLDAGNTAGVIDQLGFLRTAGVQLTAGQQEKYADLLARAWYGRGDEKCLSLLADFVTAYPASPLTPQARMASGDFHFLNHDWPEALEAYDRVDADRLNRDDRTLLNYRRALSMMRTGHFREARPLIAQLRGVKGYTDAYRFYNAYLDYIDGDFTKAYEGFSRVPEGIPGLDAGYYMAQIEYSRGQYEAVINRGTRLLRADAVPEIAPELNRIIGLSYFKRGDADKAARFLQRYLATTGGAPSADVAYALGTIDYDHGDYEAAAEKFATLTDLPDEIGQGAWLYMGLCNLRRDNPTAAAMAFEKASKESHDPAVTETALYNYVTAVTRGGKVPFSSSSRLLERFISNYPDSEYTPEVEAYLATAYYNDREYTKALRIIDAIRHPSAEVLATKQKVLYRLGVEALTNGRAENAVPYLRQAADMRSADRSLAAQSSLWLGDAFAALGNWQQARAAYEAFLASNPSGYNRQLAYYDLGYAKYRLKDYAGAAAELARVGSGSQLPAQLVRDARLLRADCLYYTARYGEARSLFSRAVEEGGSETDYALYRRAILNGLAGDTKGKLADLSRIDSEFPDSRWRSKALLEMAVLYEEQGKQTLAADAYRKRLDASADVDTDELLRMASTMHKAGRAADLLDVAARVRAAGGLEADELATLDLYEADALSELGRDSEAKAIYTRLSLNPSSEAGSEAAVKLAEISLKNKDFSAARDMMEAFTDTGTPHQYWLARGFIALADAYRGLGDKQLAREYLISLRDNYPNADDDIYTTITSRLKSLR